MLYPILTPSRTLSDLSGLWDFALGGEALDEDLAQRPLPSPVPMPVPAS